MDNHAVIASVAMTPCRRSTRARFMACTWPIAGAWSTHQRGWRLHRQAGRRVPGWCRLLAPRAASVAPQAGAPVMERRRATAAARWLRGEGRTTQVSYPPRRLAVNFDRRDGRGRSARARRCRTSSMASPVDPYLGKFSQLLAQCCLGRPALLVAHTHSNARHVRCEHGRHGLRWRVAVGLEQLLRQLPLIVRAEVGAVPSWWSAPDWLWP